MQACTSPENEQGVRQLMLPRGGACHNCGSSGSFIIKSARWSTMSPPTLDVASNCANYGKVATTPLSLEEARRCGFEDLD